MTVSENLRKAADVIESQGLISGIDGMLVGEGPKCALGAIGQATGAATYLVDITTTNSVPPDFIERYAYVDTPEVYELAEHLELTGPVFVTTLVWQWSDRSNAQDVIDALRGAAEQYDREHETAEVPC